MPYTEHHLSLHPGEFARGSRFTLTISFRIANLPKDLSASVAVTVGKDGIDNQVSSMADGTVSFAFDGTKFTAYVEDTIVTYAFWPPVITPTVDAYTTVTPDQPLPPPPPTKSGGDWIDVLFQSMDSKCDATGMAMAMDMYRRGEKQAAMRSYAYTIVQRCASTRCATASRLENCTHPRTYKVAQYLAGLVGDKAYHKIKTASMFLDIYGMRNGEGDDINWLAGPQREGYDEGKQKKPYADRYEVEYATWRHMNGLLYLFWATGNSVYAEAWIRITGSFCHPKHGHLAMLISRFGDSPKKHKEAAESLEPSGLSSCLWNSDASSAFSQAGRVDAIICGLSVLARAAGITPIPPADADAFKVNEDFKKTWRSKEYMDPVSDIMTPALLDRVVGDSPERILAIVYSLVFHHPGALVERYQLPNANPNQRLAGLRALAQIVHLFPEFTHISNELRRVVDKAIGSFLSESFYKDGHMFEHSLNYNHGDAEKLESLLSIYEGEQLPSGWPLAIRASLHKWECAIQSISTPAGVAPVIGNSTLGDPKTLEVWRMSPKERKGLRDGAKKSIHHRYSGYYAQVGEAAGVGWDSLYLFAQASRKNGGHFTHATGSVEIWAWGRQLVAPCGPPFYRRWASSTAKKMNDLFDEDCTWKTNTVVPKGYVQAHTDDRPKDASVLPMLDGDFEMTEGIDKFSCTYDYGGYMRWPPSKGKGVKRIKHMRRVVFWKPRNAWTIIDSMEGDTKEAGTEMCQIWNFPPSSKSEECHGFKRSHIRSSEKKQTVLCSSKYGPGMVMQHYLNQEAKKEGGLEYKTYFGDTRKMRGWCMRGNDVLKSVSMDVRFRLDKNGKATLYTFVMPVQQGEEVQAVDRLNPFFLEV